MYLPEAKKSWWQKTKDLVKATFMPQKYSADTFKSNNDDQIANSKELAKRREDYDIAKAKADYLFQIERDHTSRQFQLERDRSSQEFQLERDRDSREFAIQQSNEAFDRQIQLANLSAANQKELERYRQECENLRQKDRQEWDKFLLAERHRLELEVQKRQQAFAIYQMYLQAQITRDTEQFRMTLANHPWRLPPVTILNGYEHYREGDRPMPPLVVVSPPDVNFDRYSPQPNQFLGSMAKSLEEEMRVFLEPYSQQDLVNFKAGLWDTKRMASDTAATHLHDLFGTIPTIILESEVEGDFINFRQFWWDMGAEKYQSMTILSQFSLAQLLFEIQREYARKWEQEKALLESVSIDPKSVMVEGSDEIVDEFNLNQLKKEQQLQAIGSTVQVPYRAHRKGMLELKKYLRVLHCLVAALSIDDYHLTRYGAFPKLPSLIANLFTDLSETETHYLLDILVEHYRNLAKLFTEFDSVRVPSIMLAMSKELAKQQIAHAQAQALMDIAVASWLEIRHIEAGEDPFGAVEANLTIADVEFVADLNQALKDLGIDRHFDIATSCYQRGIRRNQSGEYGAARADFEQVISLNPHADAYFQRGFSCLKLQDYASAVNDFDSAAMLQSQRAEIYEYRGDTYLGLKNYEVAIANYNQAIHLGSSNAVSKLDKLQAWFTVERRRQQEAEAARQAAEAERKRIEAERRKALIFELPNNGGTIEFVWIPAGNLTIGGRTLQIPEFRMSKYPITQKQYTAVTKKANPSHFKKGDDFPVETVTWHDAKEFCTMLGNEPIMNSLKVQLPNEVYWEYACRGRTTSKFWFGENDNDLKDYAWYTDNSQSSTHSVKEKKKGSKTHPFELVDMHGNVLEWCENDWTDLPDLVQNDKYLLSGKKYSSRTVRGGAWLSFADSCASASREAYNANYQYNCNGFRVVLVES